jgi:hypothetical protein
MSLEREQKLENIPGLEPSAWVIIKKFSGAQSARIKGRSFNISVSLQNPKDGEGTMDMYKFMVNMLAFGTKEASFLKPGMTDEEKLAYYESDALDSDAFDHIWGAINKFNKPPSEELLKK